MIKDKALWEAWQAQGPLRQPADFWKHLRLLEAMYAHARSLGVFPPSNPLEGLETKIAMAKVLNVCTAARADRPGA